MPTPSDSNSSLQFLTDPHAERSVHPSCPPESDRNRREQIPVGPDNRPLRHDGVDTAPLQPAHDEMNQSSQSDATINPPTAGMPTAESVLPGDMSSSDIRSLMHLDSVAPASENPESKDEEPEVEHPLSPDIERVRPQYVDDGTSTEDDKFSNIRVYTLLFFIRYDPYNPNQMLT